MRCAVLACLLIPSLASAGDPSESAGSARGGPLRGNVLVWHDARFVLDPERPSSTVQLATLEGPRSTQLGLAAPMRVIGTRGELVEVEPSAETDCVWSRLLIHQVKDVRLFVRRTDLAPVLTRPFAATYDDGTAVALEPGVPVIALGGGAHRVLIGSQQVPVEVPGASVGHAYAPPAPAAGGTPIESKLTLFRMTAGTAARLGRHTFTTSRALFGAMATRVTRSGKTTLFPIGGRCAEATVALPSDRVYSVEEDGGMGGFGTGIGTPMSGDFLPAGTPLFTRSGRRLGVTSEEVAIDRPGKRICIDLHARFEQSFSVLAGHPGSRASSRRLTVCARQGTKLVHRRMPGGFGERGLGAGRERRKPGPGGR